MKVEAKISKKRRRHVLMIQHAAHEHPAILKRVLETQGISSSVVKIYENCTIPDLKEISGVISLGGPMHANDRENHPWIPVEIELLRQVAHEGRPVVGICLGAQLLALSLGATVERNKYVEIGWHPIRSNLDGLKDTVFSALGHHPVVYQWHEDTFHLPNGAVALASSDCCERQAFRFGERAYGFQFHPEADHQLVEEWLSIENVEHELTHLIAKEGSKNVHSAASQVKEAYLHEINSLTITTSFSNLFRERQFSRGSESVANQVRAIAQDSSCTIGALFESPNRDLRELTGTIHRTIRNSFADFIIIRDADGLLWPIRLDDIIRLQINRPK